MKLNIKKRAAKSKSESKQLRRDGYIPAVMYVRGQPSETITITEAEFSTLLRKISKGRLSTSIFELTNESKVTKKAIIKEITYDPVTYNVIHLDFEELIDGVPISLNVPIECIGTADCQGVKLGGVIRQVIRTLRVRCLPADIPEVFQLDVKNLGLWEAKRLADIQLSPTLRPQADLKEVAVTIAKR
jgi:large subunit ribosomal protein L25